jgi:uncharacterized protein (TIGR02680 family)
MTATLHGTPNVAADLDQTRPKTFPNRWRMNRAGIINVWHYYDETFEFSGGRMLLRGTNGAGKSRALEMLLPFVLDGDRRKMDATGSGSVQLGDLMKQGSAGQKNRLGYLWLELVRTPPEVEAGDEQPQYLTIGALVKWSAAAAKSADPVYFTTGRRVGYDLPLLSAERHPLPKDKLADLIGADRMTDSAPAHRERVGSAVFTLEGDHGKERYDGLLGLLHTLRSPDVGNRIDKGSLPTILSESLPPLSEDSLNTAGEHLDSLSESRDAQRHRVDALATVNTFLGVYRRYTAAVLTDTANSGQTAAAAAAAANRRALSKAKQRDDLAARHTDQAAELVGLEALVEELQSTIDGIKGSKAYADGVNIANLDNAVTALAGRAKTSLKAAASARREETETVERIDAAGDEVAAAAAVAAAALAQAAALLGNAKLNTGAMPDLVAANTAVAPPATDPVRTSLDGDPETIQRPAPQFLTLTPADLGAAIAGARSSAQAATRRAGEAENRRHTARTLVVQRSNLEHAEATAVDGFVVAGAEDTAHQNLAQTRDQAARDLAAGWREWTTSPATATLLGPVNWDGTAVGPLLADLDLLAGDVQDAPAGEGPSSGAPPALASLDGAAQDGATPAREALALTMADLAAGDRSDQAQAADLLAEQANLLAANDPPPPAPPWVAPLAAGAVPLWAGLDFTYDLAGAERAGLEAALLAAGLLSAQVEADGSVRAAGGQVLICSDAPTAPSPLSAALVPDPDAALPAGVIANVLARVGLGAGSHSTWVDVDGSWGNGPLRGKHTLHRATHIGASARAAARAARLAQIATEQERLADQISARRQQRSEATAAGQAISTHLRRAPRSDQLAVARARTADQGARAMKARQDATALGAAATEARTAWKAAEVAHHDNCDRLDLPYEPDALGDVKAVAQEAAVACVTTATALAALDVRRAKHQVALAGLDAGTQRRVGAETEADLAWSGWHAKSAEFVALTQNLGQEAEAVRVNLAAALGKHADAKRELSTARIEADELVGQAATAVSEALTAADLSAARAADLQAAAAELARVVALPGVAAAATAGADFVAPTIAPGPVASGVVEVAAAAVLDAVGTPKGGPADQTALLRAQQHLEREVAGMYDVVATVDGGVFLFELSDATGRRPVAAAAAKMATDVAEGKGALSTREHTVFTEFVLGGVGDELRRRLSQAGALVAAMNASLSGIETSHGISVRLRWDLTDSVGSPVARIRELVQASTAVRPLAQTDELVGLLKDRVAEQFDLDPTAGYANHLRNALDYRLWHKVVVSVLGPAPDQVRAMGPRMRLSQGETRFVSYVTLFAAADAYLSGLPDTGRALRLILLDDAFAKVDDRTIGELMGLLVRLDIDFALTGHALWGTYPQVPSLDVYEVVRGEGTAAVTTHIHWDGRNRHLRSAR